MHILQWLILHGRRIIFRSFGGFQLVLRGSTLLVTLLVFRFAFCTLSSISCLQLIRVNNLYRYSFSSDETELLVSSLILTIEYKLKMFISK